MALDLTFHGVLAKFLHGMARPQDEFLFRSPKR
jgi:hypothetical protein